MTGYGRATQNYGAKVITVEMRSLNSKFTDIRMKVPANFREKEHELRRFLSDRVERGKIDLSIEVKSFGSGDAFGLNVPLFKKYYQEISALTEEMGGEKDGIIAAILRIPEVVMSAEDSIDEEEWKAIQGTLDKAFESFHSFRQAEGGAMEKDLRLRVNNIHSALQEVDPFERGRVDLLRNRLKQNLEEFLGKDNVDENRFEQEVLFYLEKIDITEEKVRLAQHCKFFLEQLDAERNTKGRKLSFISQEMGREINTLGAKAYSADIQRIVVRMKDDLEKIKEQVANSV
jgi:uncharacterized protein (TIGR00255 family)